MADGHRDLDLKIQPPEHLRQSMDDISATIFPTETFPTWDVICARF
jgi:hypothetical protein